MKKFTSTILLFAVPFIFILIIMSYLDPFNIIHEEKDSKMEELKKNISYKINYPLYKLQEYSYHPTEIIILGDSRANKLSQQAFDSINGEQVTNLAYGAGTMEEIVETFWIINEMHKLKKVYIGINFNLYNALNNGNRVKDANRLRNNKVSYLTSKYCIKSSFYILKSLITGGKVDIEKPPFSKEEFWEHQLITSGPSFYQNYKYPSTIKKDLVEMSRYCHDNNIKLVFFIPPTHIDLQDKIKEYHLEKENEQFKKDLISLNMPLYDFDFENIITKNKQNFSDPYHFTRKLVPILVNVISEKNYETQMDSTIYKSLGN